MGEQAALIRGEVIFQNFINDLSQMMDHSYDIAEIVMLYRDWARRGELFVNEFVLPMHPPSYRPREDGKGTECIEADDFIALRNAMINLYCALDAATPGLDRRRIYHAAYSEQDETFIILLR